MATGAEQAHGAAAPGMPQLDFTTFPNQIFWLVVTLVVIYLVLTRLAIPRIATVLAERRGTVANDLATAEELKLKAQEAEATYEKALADARAEAQKIVAEARAEINRDLDAANARAEAEIAARLAESETRIAAIRDTATENVRAVARETAVEVARAILPAAASDPAALVSAVDRRMEMEGGA
ncbi:MAG: F0F1 ATP synthase subunit B' [Rhodobacteraceae bacterium]|jgi:F-type H+-transporting ATPase subunit b|nr:F0F1 ATP synthase subunit B' [Paracoccaceae bacterium]MBL4556320.1 F0F1 ATP synthase subunit B' [Paracoccaceae bacterium]HBG99832.1 ATP F0F1 synthase subunit B' [Paracoccaceae bacterium]